MLRSHDGRNLTDEEINIIESKGHETVCMVCRMTFSSRKTLRGHMLVKHPTEAENLGLLSEKGNTYTEGNGFRKCNICDETFFKESELNLHRQTEHSSDKDAGILLSAEKPLQGAALLHKVSKNEQEFGYLTMFSSQLRSMETADIASEQNGNNSETVDCQSDNGQLDGFVSGPVKCLFCSECYSDPQGLIDHMFLSHDEHPDFDIFVPLLRKRYNHFMSPDLQEHDLKKKAFPCEECGKCFVKPKTLFNHLFVNHEKQPSAVLLSFVKFQEQLDYLFRNILGRSAEQLLSDVSNVPPLNGFDSCSSQNETNFNSQEIFDLTEETVVPSRQSPAAQPYQNHENSSNGSGIPESGGRESDNDISNGVPLQCCFCRKPFTYAQHMINHLKSNHSEKPQYESVIEVVSKTFNYIKLQQSCLKRMRPRKSSKGRERMAAWYRCPKHNCGKAFHGLHIFNRHLRHNHFCNPDTFDVDAVMIKDPESEGLTVKASSFWTLDQMYKCSVEGCGKIMRGLNIFRRHLNITHKIDPKTFNANAAIVAPTSEKQRELQHFQEKEATSLGLVKKNTDSTIPLHTNELIMNCSEKLDKIHNGSSVALDDTVSDGSKTDTNIDAGSNAFLVLKKFNCSNETFTSMNNAAEVSRNYEQDIMSERPAGISNSHGVSEVEYQQERSDKGAIIDPVSSASLCDIQSGCLNGPSNIDIDSTVSKAAIDSSCSSENVNTDNGCLVPSSSTELDCSGGNAKMTDGVVTLLDSDQLKCSEATTISSSADVNIVTRNMRTKVAGSSRIFSDVSNPKINELNNCVPKKTSDNPGSSSQSTCNATINGNLKCWFCPKGFTYPSALIKHLKLLHRENARCERAIRTVADHCQNIKSQRQLYRKLMGRRHSRTMKSVRQWYRCSRPNCDKRFWGLNIYSRHLQFSHGVIPDSIDQDADVITDPEAEGLSASKTFSSFEKKHKCPFLNCGMIIIGFHILNRHLKHIHDIDPSIIDKDATDFSEKRRTKGVTVLSAKSECSSDKVGVVVTTSHADLSSSSEQKYWCPVGSCQQILQGLKIFSHHLEKTHNIDPLAIHKTATKFYQCHPRNAAYDRLSINVNESLVQQQDNTAEYLKTLVWKNDRILGVGINQATERLEELKKFNQDHKEQNDVSCSGTMESDVALDSTLKDQFRAKPFLLLCDQCRRPFRKKWALDHHKLVAHGIKLSRKPSANPDKKIVDFVKICGYCGKVFIKPATFISHLRGKHNHQAPLKFKQLMMHRQWPPLKTNIHSSSRLQTKNGDTGVIGGGQCTLRSADKIADIKSQQQVDAISCSVIGDTDVNIVTSSSNRPAEVFSPSSGSQYPSEVTLKQTTSGSQLSSISYQGREILTKGLVKKECLEDCFLTTVKEQFVTNKDSDIGGSADHSHFSVNRTTDERNMQGTASDVPVAFVCPCGEICHSFTTFCSHKFKTHGLRTMKCLYCDSHFVRPKMFRKHVEREHSRTPPSLAEIIQEHVQLMRTNKLSSPIEHESNDSLSNNLSHSSPKLASLRDSDTPNTSLNTYVSYDSLQRDVENIFFSETNDQISSHESGLPLCSNIQQQESSFTEVCPSQITTSTKTLDDPQMHNNRSTAACRLPRTLPNTSYSSGIHQQDYAIKTISIERKGQCSPAVNFKYNSNQAPITTDISSQVFQQQDCCSDETQQASSIETRATQTGQQHNSETAEHSKSHQLPEQNNSCVDETRVSISDASGLQSSRSRINLELITRDIQVLLKDGKSTDEMIPGYSLPESDQSIRNSYVVLGDDLMPPPPGYSYMFKPYLVQHFSKQSSASSVSSAVHHKTPSVDQIQQSEMPMQTEEECRLPDPDLPLETDSISTVPLSSSNVHVEPSLPDHIQPGNVCMPSQQQRLSSEPCSIQSESSRSVLSSVSSNVNTLAVPSSQVICRSNVHPQTQLQPQLPKPYTAHNSNPRASVTSGIAVLSHNTQGSSQMQYPTILPQPLPQRQSLESYPVVSRSSPSSLSSKSSVIHYKPSPSVDMQHPYVPIHSELLRQSSEAYPSNVSRLTSFMSSVSTEVNKSPSFAYKTQQPASSRSSNTQCEALLSAQVLHQRIISRSASPQEQSSFNNHDNILRARDPEVRHRHEKNRLATDLQKECVMLVQNQVHPITATGRLVFDSPRFNINHGIPSEKPKITLLTNEPLSSHTNASEVKNELSQERSLSANIDMVGNNQITLPDFPTSSGSYPVINLDSDSCSSDQESSSIEGKFYPITDGLDFSSMKSQLQSNVKVEEVTGQEDNKLQSSVKVEETVQLKNNNACSYPNRCIKPGGKSCQPDSLSPGSFSCSVINIDSDSCTSDEESSGVNDKIYMTTKMAGFSSTQSQLKSNVKVEELTGEEYNKLQSRVKVEEMIQQEANNTSFNPNQYCETGNESCRSTKMGRKGQPQRFIKNNTECTRILIKEEPAEEYHSVDSR